MVQGCRVHATPVQIGPNPASPPVEVPASLVETSPAGDEEVITVDWDADDVHTVPIQPDESHSVDESDSPSEQESQRVGRRPPLAYPAEDPRTLRMDVILNPARVELHGPVSVQEPRPVELLVPQVGVDT